MTNTSPQKSEVKSDKKGGEKEKEKEKEKEPTKEAAVKREPKLATHSQKSSTYRLHIVNKLGH
jgi:hypothetical protein